MSDELCDSNFKDGRNDLFCCKLKGHDGFHEYGDWEWKDDQPSGYFPESKEMSEELRKYVYRLRECLAVAAALAEMEQFPSKENLKNWQSLAYEEVPL